MKTKIDAIEEMIQVVVLAIPKETEAYESYTNAGAKAVSDRSRNLFAVLAAQEKGHEAELRRILLELKTELSELRRS
jgi:rubrerythrin